MVTRINQNNLGWSIAYLSTSKEILILFFTTQSVWNWNKRGRRRRRVEGACSPAAVDHGVPQAFAPVTIIADILLQATAA